MVEKHQLEWVIEQHYRTIDRHYNQRMVTKSWCLTVWLGLVILICFENLRQTFNLYYIVSFVPITLFWLIEAMQASHMKIMELRVTELEKLWTNGESRIKNLNDILFYGSHQYQSSKIKANLFIFALFKMETVSTFYLLLYGLNVIFLIIASIII